jgi:hypothetical protein
MVPGWSDIYINWGEYTKCAELAMLIMDLVIKYSDTVISSPLLSPPISNFTNTDPRSKALQAINNSAIIKKASHATKKQPGSKNYWFTNISHIHNT